MALRTNLIATVLAGALGVWLGGAGYAQAPQSAERSVAAPGVTKPKPVKPWLVERRPPKSPQKPPKKSRGAPGPVAGAGLPILVVAGGAYWLLRRRRNRVHRA